MKSPAWLFSSIFVTLIAASSSCPTVVPVDNFDLDEYVAKTWYVQRQQLNSYQGEDDLFCVTATYDRGGSQWFRSAVSVENVQRSGSVDGSTGGGPGLCATVVESETVGELQVAPCFLPSFFAGPYWVVAVATDYSWAIITGGQPRLAGSCGDSDNFCTTPQDRGSFLQNLFRPIQALNGNDQGLWFFSRAPVADEATIAEMEQVAASLGICTASMKPVQQQGCDYSDRRIKE